MKLKMERLSLICDSCHKTLATLSRPATDEDKVTIEALVEAHKRAKPHKKHKLTARFEGVV